MRSQGGGAQGRAPLALIEAPRHNVAHLYRRLARAIPDGTAFDRAWKGIANPESMIEAIAVATHMLGARGN